MLKETFSPHTPSTFFTNHALVPLLFSQFNFFLFACPLFYTAPLFVPLCYLESFSFFSLSMSFSPFFFIFVRPLWYSRTGRELQKGAYYFSPHCWSIAGYFPSPCPPNSSDCPFFLLHMHSGRQYYLVPPSWVKTKGGEPPVSVPTFRSMRTAALFGYSVPSPSNENDLIVLKPFLPLKFDHTFLLDPSLIWPNFVPPLSGLWVFSIAGNVYSSWKGPLTCFAAMIRWAALLLLVFPPP